MSDRTIYLHVGHGKTGTSYLQSALANSLDALAAHGISYPLDPDEAARVRAGGISSGNIVPAPRHLVPLLERGDPALLLSSESLFFKLRPNQLLETLRKHAPQARVKVMLYVRDPLDHVVSKYQQRIKRGGSTEAFEDFLEVYNQPGNVGQFMTWLETHDVEITVCNYSRHRADLLDTLSAWIGMPEGALKAPEVRQVNRSMTNSEIALQMAFNRHLGADSARYVSDVLCEALPDVRSQRPPATPAALEAFLQRMKEMIALHRLDTRFAASERYVLPDLDAAVARFDAPVSEPVFGFSAAQLQVLAEALCAQMTTPPEAPARGRSPEERAIRRAAREAKLEKRAARADARRKATQ
ncbi:MAG: hypothetical protein AAGK30_02925 [Pseudomonadota bacterium]